MPKTKPDNGNARVITETKGIYDKLDLPSALFALSEWFSRDEIRNILFSSVENHIGKENGVERVAQFSVAIEKLVKDSEGIGSVEEGADELEDVV